MKKVVLCEHQTLPDGTQIPGCGERIVFVLVIPKIIRPGIPRKKIPLNAEYDPASGIRASHAVQIDWATCRPLAQTETADRSEIPALTHYATCIYRRKTYETRVTESAY